MSTGPTPDPDPAPPPPAPLAIFVMTCGAAEPLSRHHVVLEGDHGARARLPVPAGREADFAPGKKFAVTFTPAG